MRSTHIVALRVTIFFLVIALLVLGARGWDPNPWLLVFLLPTGLAYLTMLIDRQDGQSVILRTPLLRLHGHDLGAASVDTTVWPKEDQRSMHEYAALCSISYRKKNEDTTPPEGWELLTKANDGDIAEPGKDSWRIRAGGLHWEIWGNTTVSPARAAIVFRGTEPLELGDWIANARWVGRFFFWDQYSQLRLLASKLVRFARERVGEDAEIVSTGHSLGGGLAQQLAYCVDDVKLVYAFQSSPVTGYRSTAKPLRERGRQGLRIYRVFEHGEVLSYLRWVLRALVPLNGADPRIVEARYNLSGGGPLRGIGQHSMTTLARELAERARPLA